MKSSTVIVAMVILCLAAFVILLSFGLTKAPGGNAEVRVPTDVDTKAPSANVLALSHCQRMAEPDDTCRDLWAQNRRHFLGQDAASSAGDQ